MWDEHTMANYTALILVLFMVIFAIGGGAYYYFVVLGNTFGGGKGYTFTQGMNYEGQLLGLVGEFGKSTPEVLMEACDEKPQCEGFNTDGYLKTNLGRAVAVPSWIDPLQANKGWYMKKK